MGFDYKYGKVTTELGDIPEDEPVVVFRGRDIAMPSVMLEYYALCVTHGAPSRHLAIVAETHNRIKQWQADNPDKVVTPLSAGKAGRTYHERNTE